MHGGAHAAQAPVQAIAPALISHAMPRAPAGFLDVQHLSFSALPAAVAGANLKGLKFRLISPSTDLRCHFGVAAWPPSARLSFVVALSPQWPCAKPTLTCSPCGRLARGWRSRGRWHRATTVASASWKGSSRLRSAGQSPFSTSRCAPSSSTKVRACTHRVCMQPQGQLARVPRAFVKRGDTFLPRPAPPSPPSRPAAASPPSPCIHTRPTFSCLCT